ncbi:zinc ribbon domain-containing protein [Xanthobacter aminoxidans]|uniref:zinc ribbon domain-containing protein n=1 Tax=Xanthobacter aminoxidans TaxID=186280 RepID=UPI003727E3C7
MEFIAIMLIGAILNGLLASARGRSVPGWALFGAFFPLISLLVLVLMKNLKAESETAGAAAHAAYMRSVEDRRAALYAQENEKTCPRCAETVKKAALVCRFCGHEFAPPP